MLKIQRKEEGPSSPATNPGQRLLIVDDELPLLKLLERLFSGKYNVRTASSGDMALTLLREGFDPQVILADQRMPGMSGAEFLARSRQLLPDAVRVILTGYTDVNDIIASINEGHVYKFLTKPWQNEDLLQTVHLCFEYYAITTENKLLVRAVQSKNAQLAEMNKTLSQKNEELLKLNTEIKDSMLQSIRMMTGLITEGEYYYYNHHAQTVAQMVRHIAGAMELSPDSVRHITFAALLHDIGKIGMPERYTLPEPESLSKPDFEVYKSHVQKGVRRILNIKGMEKVAEIVLQHHEHYDGTGFPFGLMRGQVSVESQILSITDAYHNLVYKIPAEKYYKAESTASLRLEGRELSERQEFAIKSIIRKAYRYNPEVVRAFYKVAKSGKCEPLQLGSFESSFEGAKIEFDISDKEVPNFRPVPRAKPTERASMRVLMDKVEPGMVLAQDLYSTYGNFLLPRGKAIDADALEIIQSFHDRGILPEIVMIYEDDKVSDEDE